MKAEEWIRSRFISSIGTMVLSGTLVSCQSAEATKTAGEQAQKGSQAPATVEQAEAADSPADTSAVQQERKLIVYYFHTTARCRSCNMIENLTRTAVETGFPEAVNSGRVEFQLVNIEKEGNQHFVQDYKLYTKSVVLSDLRDGKETQWKNLDQVWTLLGNKDKFIEYVQKEVRALL